MKKLELTITSSYFINKHTAVHTNAPFDEGFYGQSFMAYYKKTVEKDYQLDAISVKDVLAYIPSIVLMSIVKGNIFVFNMGKMFLRPYTRDYAGIKTVSTGHLVVFDTESTTFYNAFIKRELIGLFYKYVKCNEFKYPEVHAAYEAVCSRNKEYLASITNKFMQIKMPTFKKYKKYDTQTD